VSAFPMGWDQQFGIAKHTVVTDRFRRLVVGWDDGVRLLMGGNRQHVVFEVTRHYQFIIFIVLVIDPHVVFVLVLDPLARYGLLFDQHRIFPVALEQRRVAILILNPMKLGLVVGFVPR